MALTGRRYTTSDLAAKNKPDVYAEQDARTPAELIAITEEKDRDVVAALERLRALS